MKNVLLVITDDQRYNTIHALGNPDIRTPNLDWLAQQSGISKYYLSRTFHTYFSISPMQYLCQRRIHEARHLLTTTDHSQDAIAILCGFSSPSYFSQAFKRVAGVNPSEYRRRQRMR